jgi:hypothetical protein
VGLIIHLDNGFDRQAGKGQTHRLMNTVIVRTVPPGDFEEISVEMPDWKATFLNLVQQGKRIHYDVHSMPTIHQRYSGRTQQGNYFDFILEGDHDHHFLIAKSN